MTRPADRFTLYVPDLRGFGDSDKPDGPHGPEQHATDMLALMDALGVMQAGVEPGIGPRMAEPERLNNIWYQSFNQLDIAPVLIGASRENCRAYFGYLLKHWSHRKHAFDDVLEAYVDNFLKPGNLAGSFAYYRAAHAGRIRMLKGEAPQLAPINIPTCVRSAEYDPLFPYAWTDRLGEIFSDLDLAMFSGVGHFPHREDPDRAAREIAAFFTRIGWVEL